MSDAPPTIWTTEDQAWGDHVSWFDYKKGKVYGHKSPHRPKVGDLLRSPLQSGRMGVFRFTDVRLLTDPHDMFFGDVEAVGYEDEIDDLPAQGSHWPEDDQ